MWALCDVLQPWGIARCNSRTWYGLEVKTSISEHSFQYDAPLIRSILFSGFVGIKWVLI